MDERLSGSIVWVDGHGVTRVRGVGARDLQPDGTLRTSDQDSFAVAQFVKALEEVDSA